MIDPPFETLFSEQVHKDYVDYLKGINPSYTPISTDVIPTTANDVDVSRLKELAEEPKPFDYLIEDQGLITSFAASENFIGRAFILSANKVSSLFVKDDDKFSVHDWFSGNREYLQEIGLNDTYERYLLGSYDDIDSEDELIIYLGSDIMEAEARRQIQEAPLLANLGAGVLGAGLLDPINFIPLGFAAKGKTAASTIGRTIARGNLTATAQEFGLQALDVNDLRPVEETMANIVLNTVFDATAVSLGQGIKRGLKDVDLKKIKPKFGKNAPPVDVTKIKSGRSADNLFNPDDIADRAKKAIFDQGRKETRDPIRIQIGDTVRLGDNASGLKWKDGVVIGHGEFGTIVRTFDGDDIAFDADLKPRNDDLKITDIAKGDSTDFKPFDAFELQYRDDLAKGKIKDQPIPEQLFDDTDINKVDEGGQPDGLGPTSDQKAAQTVLNRALNNLEDAKKTLDDKKIEDAQAQLDIVRVDIHTDQLAKLRQRPTVKKAEIDRAELKLENAKEVQRLHQLPILRRELQADLRKEISNLVDVRAEGDPVKIAAAEKRHATIIQNLRDINEEFDKNRSKINNQTREARREFEEIRRVDLDTQKKAAQQEMADAANEIIAAKTPEARAKAQQKRNAASDKLKDIDDAIDRAAAFRREQGLDRLAPSEPAPKPKPKTKTKLSGEEQVRAKNADDLRKGKKVEVEKYSRQFKKLKNDPNYHIDENREVLGVFDPRTNEWVGTPKPTKLDVARNELKKARQELRDAQTNPLASQRLRDNLRKKRNDAVAKVQKLTGEANKPKDPNDPGGLFPTNAATSSTPSSAQSVAGGAIPPKTPKDMDTRYGKIPEGEPYAGAQQWTPEHENWFQKTYYNAIEWISDILQWNAQFYRSGNGVVLAASNRIMYPLRGTIAATKGKLQGKPSFEAEARLLNQRAQFIKDRAEENFIKAFALGLGPVKTAGETLVRMLETPVGIKRVEEAHDAWLELVEMIRIARTLLDREGGRTTPANAKDVLASLKDTNSTIITGTREGNEAYLRRINVLAERVTKGAQDLTDLIDDTLRPLDARIKGLADTTDGPRNINERLGNTISLRFNQDGNVTFADIVATVWQIFSSANQSRRLQLTGFDSQMGVAKQNGIWIAFRRTGNPNDEVRIDGMTKPLKNVQQVPFDETTQINILRAINDNDDISRMIFGRKFKGLDDLLNDIERSTDADSINNAVANIINKWNTNGLGNQPIHMVRWLYTEFADSDVFRFNFNETISNGTRYLEKKAYLQTLLQVRQDMLHSYDDADYRIHSIEDGVTRSDNPNETVGGLKRYVEDLSDHDKPGVLAEDLTEAEIENAINRLTKDLSDYGNVLADKNLASNRLTAAQHKIQKAQVKNMFAMGKELIGMNQELRATPEGQTRLTRMVLNASRTLVLGKSGVMAGIEGLNTVATHVFARGMQKDIISDIIETYRGSIKQLYKENPEMADFMLQDLAFLMENMRSKMMNMAEGEFSDSRRLGFDFNHGKLRAIESKSGKSFLERVDDVLDASAALVSKMSYLEKTTNLNKQMAFLFGHRQLLNPDFGVIPIIAKAIKAGDDDVLQSAVNQGADGFYARLVLQAMSHEDITNIAEIVAKDGFNLIKPTGVNPLPMQSLDNVFRFKFFGSGKIELLDTSRVATTEQRTSVSNLAKLLNFIASSDKTSEATVAERLGGSTGTFSKFYSQFLTTRMRIINGQIIARRGDGARGVAVMTALLGAEAAGQYLKSWVNGRNEEYFTEMQEKPLVFAGQIMLDAGVGGIIAEKVIVSMYDAAYGEGLRRMNPGQYQLMPPAYSVLQQGLKTPRALVDWYQGDATPSQERTLLKWLVLPETLPFKAAGRILDLTEFEQDNPF